MKLEQAIQSTKFKNEVHKAGLNILYTAWWLKTLMSRELKEFGLTHEQYNVLRILKGLDSAVGYGRATREKEGRDKKAEADAAKGFRDDDDD